MLDVWSMSSPVKLSSIPSDSPTVRQSDSGGSGSDSPTTPCHLFGVHTWLASKLSYWLGWHTSTQQDIYHTKADTSQHMGLVGPPALLACAARPVARSVVRFSLLVHFSTRQCSQAFRFDFNKEKCDKRKWGYLRSLGESCRS